MSDAPLAPAEPLAPPATVPRRSLWVLISTVVCCALMGAVIAAAVKGRNQNATPEAPWGAQRPKDPSARNAFVPPKGPRNPCGAIDPDRPAALTFEVAELDFGPAKQGEIATRELVFRSSGKGPLCIYQWRSGCGCFKIVPKDPDKRLFKPGERGTFVVTMDATGKVGKLHKRITVYSNSMERPVARLTCKVDVSKGLIVNRRTLSFRPVPTATPTSTSLLLYTPASDPAWEVTRVEGTRHQADGTPVAYTFTAKDVKDARVRKVLLTITNPGMPTVGVWNERIVIHTTHAERPKVTLQSHLNVVNRILTHARQVTLGHVEVGTPSKPAVVRFFAGNPSIQFTLTRAYVAPPPTGRAGVGSGMLAKIGEDEKGWFVSVHYDGRERPPGLLEGELVVRTSDRAQLEIRLPVRATIVEKK